MTKRQKILEITRLHRSFRDEYSGRNGLPATLFSSQRLSLQFSREKYFTIYFPPRTERISQMTARPVDPDSRRKPLCTAVALVLVMGALLLAAGKTEKISLIFQSIRPVKYQSAG
jgi:hypothetical protein